MKPYASATQTAPHLYRVSITYLTWTADNFLRHTVYIGLREDKPASDVRREAAHIPDPISRTAARSRAENGEHDRHLIAECGVSL